MFWPSIKLDILLGVYRGSPHNSWQAFRNPCQILSRDVGSPQTKAAKIGQLNNTQIPAKPSEAEGWKWNLAMLLSKDTSERRWMEDAIVETETNRVGRLSYAIGAWLKYILFRLQIFGWIILALSSCSWWEASLFLCTRQTLSRRTHRSGRRNSALHWVASTPEGWV